MTIISKTDKVVIEISREEFSPEQIQNFLNLMRFTKIVSKSRATKQQADEVIKSIKKGIYKRSYPAGKK